ncbi:hypothetical protein DPM19_12675 [Actinomadura craniellae]|uniref:DUF2029 domain-containing protein n=1 Tax=Actinomadura craniellae TaxID=2231787 RepID=A0A365H672_9ACTN|nr:glycosyltransferase 87 family protein [Actinomadura craniellae]RAY14614.1 hypothetical protein DPM19_12675 [Actinomadura craniellae]
MGGRTSDDEGPAPRPYPVAWLLGLAVAAAVLAPILHKWLTNPPDQRLVDLDVYRSGGEVLLRGAPLYDFLTQPPQLLPFTYPPFAALLAVPLTWLSWPQAQWVSVGLLYAALTIMVCYAFRDLIRRAGRWSPVAVGALVGAMAWMMPVFDQIRFGQVGLFLVAMCVADCAAPSPRWPRGLLVGLATAVKLVPGVFLIYFLITGRREAAGNAVLTAAAATLIGFVARPHDSLDFWFGAMLDSERAGANTATTNQSINGMLLRIYWPETITTALWLVCVAIMAYLGFRLARRASLLDVPGPGGHSAEMAGVAIVGLLSVLLSPIGWIHHLTWIVLVIGALAGDGRDPRRAFTAVAVWIYFLFPIPWYGTRMIDPEYPAVVRFLGRIVQDGYGLAAVTLVLVLGLWLTKRILAEREQGIAFREPAEMGTLKA